MAHESLTLRAPRLDSRMLYLDRSLSSEGHEVKGFPNQISNIAKLTNALVVLSNIICGGGNHDDDAFGEQLLRNGVILPGSAGGNIDNYLAASRQKPLSYQSHRTSARGLREFLHLAHLVETRDEVLGTTPAGHRLLEVHSNNDVSPLNAEWSRITRDISVSDSEGRVSHPYQIMLRILAARPGTPRAMCALALEAVDDSNEELNRVISLRDLNDEAGIRTSLGVSKSNWDNAKKILPSIAEQIGDVARGQGGLYIVTPGLAESTPGSQIDDIRLSTARRVTVASIASTKSPRDSDEAPTIDQADLVSLADAIAKRADRSNRHNLLVQQFSASLLDQSAEIWEGTFDCLAIGQGVSLLAEMKTLDGSISDEVHQVRNAAAQLLYYEVFDIRTKPELADRPLVKVAVFESVPSEPHIRWLEGIGISVVWRLGARVFATTEGSRSTLVDHLWLQGS